MNASVRTVGLIPARLAATRLPNKPLIDLLGKPMIQHVWERAMRVGVLSEVAVATPDEEIAKIVQGFGGCAIMTAHSHRSGTDRLAEAAGNMGLTSRDIVVNIQGDEPLLVPEGIEAVVNLLQADPMLAMASLMCPCPREDLDNPSCVKVVCAQNGDALYFSRARLPFERAVAHVPVMQHVGLYAYRVEFLLAYAGLAPTPLERTESLEQLRALEHGYRIRMARVEQAPIGVDTEEDLDRALKRMKDEQSQEASFIRPKVGEENDRRMPDIIGSEDEVR